MPVPDRQFRLLYRHFLSRLVDLDVLAPGGDVQKLFVQFAAMLVAFSFVLAIYIVPRYGTSPLKPSQLALAATGDQEFLIATTMAVAGIFAALSWDAIFLDRRDNVILRSLPVLMRTIFRAKLAAIATGLGVSVLAVNAVTGAVYPFVTVQPGGGIAGVIRSASAYWIATIAAAVFVFCALAAVQGIAAIVLSYRLFLRISGFLQIAAFFAVLGIYFVTPGSSEMSITAPENRSLVAAFPSFWFLGMFQELNGPVHPVFGPLAVRAAWSTAIAFTLAAIAYGLAYFRLVRAAVEQPGIAPAARRSVPGWVTNSVVTKLLPKSPERAITLFTARTLARSRQHRAILAAYAGAGLAISLAYSKTLLYGGSRIYAALRRYITVPHWYEPNVPLMAAGFVLLAFVVIGTRAIFALPSTLRANWIFRITAVHSPRSYFRGVRKAVYGIAALPLLSAAAIVYAAMWPFRPVIAHLIVLALVAVILIDRSLYEFRKLPFACSYLPGSANLKRKLAVYGTLLLVLVDFGTRIERWTLESRPRYVVLVVILVVLAVRSRVRWNAFAGAPYERVQFEDEEVPEVAPLDLHRDGAANVERYLDALDPEPEPGFRQRLKAACVKAAVVTSIVAAIGATYEQYERWQHRRHFPQVGRSVDIGGRSLNIFCSGEGSPTVVFESGAGGPGYTWIRIQHEISRVTRACWYDRAGYGWSDPAPFPRDSNAIARDLHALLHTAGVSGRYVLVGASFGGFNVRVYNGLYPEDVAGIVLVDSSHIDERESIQPEPWMELYARVALAQTLRRIGVLRLLMDEWAGQQPQGGLSAQQWLIATSFEPRTLAENAKELFLQSAKEAREAPGLGDRPLIVLTAGLPSGSADNPVEARQALARQKRWIESQKQLTRISTRAKQIVVENSRHGIQFDAPDAVVAAIREVLAVSGSPEE